MVFNKATAFTGGRTVFSTNGAIYTYTHTHTETKTKTKASILTSHHIKPNSKWT